MLVHTEVNRAPLNQVLNGVIFVVTEIPFSKALIAITTLPFLLIEHILQVIVELLVQNWALVPFVLKWRVEGGLEAGCRLERELLLLQLADIDL